MSQLHSNIDVRASNFLQDKQPLRFTGEAFEFERLGQRKSIPVSDMTAFERRGATRSRATRAAHETGNLAMIGGVFIGIFRLFSEAFGNKKTGAVIKFSVRFGEDKYFVGVSSMDIYSDILAAYVAAKPDRPEAPE